MYLTDLSISGIKLIRHLKLNFMRGGEPRMWTVLLGENGLSKTTILQCIAMAAMGTNKANQIANVPSMVPLTREHNGPAEVSLAGAIRGEFQVRAANERPGLPEGVGTARLRSDVIKAAGWSDLTGSSSWVVDGASIESESSPLTEIRARELSHYFVAGYGVTRSIPFPNASAQPRDKASDRVRSLFEPTWQIAATDFARRFPAFLGDGDFVRLFESLLNVVLVDSGLLPSIRGFHLSGEKHEDVFSQQLSVNEQMAVPAPWLSHGYQSTVAWVADLVGQALIDRRPSLGGPGDFEGLVLVDELDLHLHPSWQRRLVSTLKKVFPKLQFIATTHSPIVLAGLEADEIVRLKRAPDGGVIAETNTTNPAFLTPTELLNEFFGFGDEFPSEVGQQMHEYMVLATNPFRDDDEEQQLDTLRAELTAKNATPAIQPTPRKAANEHS